MGREMREATVERYAYDVDSLTRAMRELERAYDLNSDAFYELYRAQEVPAHIPRFDAHVWASFVEDVRRLDETSAPIDRASRAFAHA
jgi:hypothetical protein